jgi:pimeloyl-ACP methyl ester carboxylesterase
MTGATRTARRTAGAPALDAYRSIDRVRGFRVSIRNKSAGGVPLLMLNGVGAEYGLWDELRHNIDRTTVAFDVQPKHLGRRPSIRTYARFVRDVLALHRMDEVDVLGLSWGGIVAQQLAHDHPTRVNRLVLASASPGLMSVPARPSSAWALLSSSRSERDLPRLCKRLYAGDFLRDPSLVGRLGLARPIDRRTYRRQMLALTGWSSVPWLHTIKHETLILHGDDDPVVPYVNARLMHQLMPNAILRRVHDGGHLFLYTRPQVHGLQIADFLENGSSVATTQSGLGHRRARVCA